MEQILKSLFEKKERTVVGLMSGTSKDGIDAAIVKIEGSGLKSIVNLIAFVSVPYDPSIRQRLDGLFPLSNPGEISELNFLLGEAFAEAARKVVDEAGLNTDEVDLIGSHGQTIFHNPPSSHWGTPSTLQIGEPDVIAERTGITTVGDFRTRDVAAGGEGAPLVPYADYILFGKEGETRLAQNIGGIANVTLIPERIEDVVAFDTGPGNSLMDKVVYMAEGGERYDRDGRIASEGNVDSVLLSELLANPYYMQEPPKSTGEELFGWRKAEELYEKVREEKITLNDLMATLAELTVVTIALSYERFIFPKWDVCEIILSGGGCSNPVLTAGLRRRIPTVKCSTTDDYGIPSEAKEAVAFAILANELISGNPSNVPSVTGASRAVPLGKIVPGRAK
jgi:anhydro-N-acetylmuramic acid kinase